MKPIDVKSSTRIVFGVENNDKYLKFNILVNILVIYQKYTSKLIKKTDSTQKLKKSKKIPDHDKYIATYESNEFFGEIFYEKLKRAQSATNKNLNTVLKQATKHEKKIEKLQTFEFLW